MKKVAPPPAPAAPGGPMHAWRGRACFQAGRKNSRPLQTTGSVSASRSSAGTRPCR
ncbi:MAG: hypothetical protein PVTTEEND_000180, partial [Candidatus Fervidibacter sp.]